MHLRVVAYDILSLGSLLIVAVAELAIGADPIAVGAFFIACLASVMPVRLAGWHDFGASLILLIGFSYFMFAVFYKLALLQPLDDRLLVPRKAFCYVAAAMSLCTAAWYVSRKKKTLLDLHVRAQGYLHTEVFNFVLLALGTMSLLSIAWSVNDNPTGEVSDQPSYLRFFLHFPVLAIILGVHNGFRRSAGRTNLAPSAVAGLALQLVLGLVENSKLDLALGVAAYLVADVVVRGKVRWRTFILVGAGLIILIKLVSPAIHIVRQERATLSATGRIAATGEVIVGLVTGARDETEARPDPPREQLFWDFDYIGVSDSYLLERYAGIEYVDPVISHVDHRRSLGWWYLTEAITRSMPSFIAPDKGRDSLTQEVYARIGMLSSRVNWQFYPSIFFFGSVYAAWGFAGGLLAITVTYISLFVVLRICGLADLRDPVALYFFIAYHHYLIEGDLGIVLSFFDRTFWFELLIIYTLWYLLRSLTRRGSSGSHLSALHDHPRGRLLS